MLVWIGCDINSKFYEYRERVKEICAELGTDETALELPQHISLKISFEMDEEIAKHCIKDIIELLKAQKPFVAKTGELELREGLIWVRVEENENLRALHDELDQIAISYAVKQHALDKEYIFHTTVVMDENGEKLAAAYGKIKDIPYPEELKINTFLVGHSSDKVSYKVDRRIKVK